MGSASRPRVVVVTGASSGIGRAVAHKFAAEGDALVLMARSREPLTETAAECQAAGAAETFVVPLDVSRRDVVDAEFSTLSDEPGIDVVVHCAGVVGYGDFVDIPGEVFDGVVATNVLGSANVARAALRAMRQRGHGTLVLSSSVIGRMAVPRMSPYVVSKWGVRALARELQLEHRGHPDVHVVCLEPGSVDTPIYLQGATYAGVIGRPPPPVVSPERVADRVAAAVRRPHHTVRVGPANRLMELGFTVTPKLFDLLVGPLAAVAALSQEPAEPSPGNVLDPRPELNRLHGEQGNGSKAVARAVLSRLQDAVTKPLRTPRSR